jgi:hypothetical protein
VRWYIGIGKLATYNAYCIAPFFGSWLGNSTSRFGFPVTPRGKPDAFCEASALAVFDAEDEIAAIDLYGTMADVGLATPEKLGFVATRTVVRGSSPRRANAAAGRADDSILSMPLLDIGRGKVIERPHGMEGEGLWGRRREWRL